MLKPELIISKEKKCKTHTHTHTPKLEWAEYRTDYDTNEVCEAKFTSMG